MEALLPVFVSAFQIRKNSGGQGKWCGGDGVIRRLMFNEKMTASIVSNRRIVPPYGLKGGSPGKVGVNYIVRADGNMEVLASQAEVTVNPGDMFVIETPGGGGYGRFFN